MRCCAAMLAVVVLIGCREEARTMTHFTEATEQASTSAADTATAPMPVVPNPADTFVVPAPASTGASTVTLQPLTPGNLSGGASLKANGNSTIADVTLKYPAGGGTHEGFIHSGSCARLGPAVTDLHPVSTDSVGNGRAQTFIDLPLDTLRVRPHALTYGRGGRPHACGEIS